MFFGYKKLMSKFDLHLDNNNTIARAYAKAYLKKSKSDNNLKEQAVGYSLVAYTYNSIEYRIQYLDSAIVAAELIADKELPIVFNINKGGALEEIGEFKKALDYYLEASESAKKVKNQQLEFVAKHIIGFLKMRLGKYEESKQLFKSCLLYEVGKENMSKKDSLSYLITLSELVQTYRLTKAIDSALFFNKEGLLSSKGKDISYLFQLNKTVLDYYKGNYNEVIRNGTEILEKSIPLDSDTYCIKTLDLTNLYLHLGKSYDAIDNKAKAVNYYKQIDSLLQTTNYVIPEIRIAYNNLINYYKSTGDKNQQLIYINKLLKSDSILDTNHNYINDRLIKDYDTPELLEQKEALIENLTNKKNNLYLSIGLLCLALAGSFVFLISYYKKQKKYQQRFKEVISSGKEEQTILPVSKPKTVDVPEDVVHIILENLEKFENKTGYLKTNLTLRDLAIKCKTNSKYLSKVINSYKEKNFTNYINDLRIDFIIEKLKNNSKYRTYTINALATESGFNTTEAFSKSFYRKTGIYPSYFIKRLTKNVQ